MRRVLHVIDSLTGSGGAENRLVEEVVALDHRFDQLVVRLYERDELEVRLADAGIEVIGLGFKAAAAGRTWPLAVSRLYCEARRWRPDVVHTALFHGNLVGQLAARSLRLPVVSTFNRTGDVELQHAHTTGASGWKAATLQAVSRWADRRSNVHYRAVGDYVRRTNCEARGLPLDRSTVIPRGLEIGEADAPVDRAVFGLPDGGPLFVNVARRVPEKAQYLLIESFAKVRVEEPAAQLAIVGAPGPADTAIKAALAQHDLDDAVHLLGHRTDARAMVASADVFAFSSLSEGSPGAVVEALMLGTAVAAFDIDPVTELTGGDRHAWLAPSGSVDGLADAMLSALRAPDRAERTAAARSWAQRFSLRAVADQLGDLLEGQT